MNNQNNVLEFKNKVKNISNEYDIDINDSPENVEYDHTGENPDKNGLIKKEAKVVQDGTTGALFPIDDDYSDLDLDIVTEEEKRIDAEFQKVIDETELPKEYIIESLKETFNFASDEDLEVLYNVVKRLDNGEEFSVYNAIPENVRNYISTFTVGYTDRNAKRIFIKEFLSNLTTEIRSFKAYDNISKFKQEKTDEIIDNDFKELYNDYFKDQKERFEHGFRDRYELLNRDKSEEAQDKAKLALDIAEGYKESYTLTKFKKDVFSHKGKYKFKKIELEKPERYLNNFNLKYANNPDFNNADISLIQPILMEFLTKYYPEKEYTKMDTVLFIYAFVKYTMNFSANKLSDHTFMFYFVNNLRVFKLVTSEYDIEFVKTVIGNVSEIIDVLVEVNKL